MSVTTTLPCPYVTKLPENIILERSPSAASSKIGSMLFSTARLSPVRALSSTLRLAFSISLPSAGIISPASKRITSPTTSSLAGSRTTASSRNTFAWGPESFFQALQGLFRFYRLHSPQNCIHGDHDHDHCCTLHISEYAGYNCRCDQDPVPGNPYIVHRKSAGCFFFFPSVSSFQPQASLDLFTSSSVRPDSLLFTRSKTSFTVCWYIFSLSSSSFSKYTPTVSLMQ